MWRSKRTSTSGSKLSEAASSFFQLTSSLTRMVQPLIQFHLQQEELAHTMISQLTTLPFKRNSEATSSGSTSSSTRPRAVPSTHLTWSCKWPSSSKTLIRPVPSTPLSCWARTEHHSIVALFTSKVKNWSLRSRMRCQRPCSPSSPSTKEEPISNSWFL